MNKIYFKADVEENFGCDWPVAECGWDDGKRCKVHVSMNCIHASEAHMFSAGSAWKDARLIARLLNAYYNRKYRGIYND